MANGWLKEYAYSDITDAARAVGYLLALYAMAHYQIGVAAKLEDVFNVQGTGLGYWVDTLTSAAMCVYISWTFIFSNFSRRPFWFRLSNATGFSFLLIATIFHIINEGTGEQPHPAFACAFGLFGASVLYSYMHRTHALTRGTDTLMRRATIYLFILATSTTFICLFARDQYYPTVNRFFYCGYVFVFVVIATEPLLKAMQHQTKLIHFLIGRCCFPAIVFAFIAQEIGARYLRIDLHILVHICAYSFYIVMDLGLKRLPNSEIGKN